MAKYLVVCAPGFGPSERLGSQARAGRRVTEQARIVESSHDADWVLSAIKTGTVDLESIFVACIDGSKEDIAMYGVDLNHGRRA